jgi:hypothetical protein
MLVASLKASAKVRLLFEIAKQFAYFFRLDMKKAPAFSKMGRAGAVFL